MPSAVFVLVRESDGALLMERRPDGDPWFPGEWVFPAGKLEDGELPYEACTREIREELGVQPTGIFDLATFTGATYHARSPKHEGDDPSHRMHPFLVVSWAGEVPGRVLDSGAPLAWVTQENARSSKALWVWEVAAGATYALKQIAEGRLTVVEQATMAGLGIG
jgi:8-oxo-dGTP pyrophosphatase MutT (NUDIX family)